MTKNARNKEEEMAAREEVDYNNTKEEYDDKLKRVELAEEMALTEFYKQGFKSRRETLDKTRKAFQQEAEEKSADDYDSEESIKAINKAKLNYTNALKEFDSYTADVQFAIDVLHAFNDREDQPLLNDMAFKTATFSRKTGKISWKKAK